MFFMRMYEPLPGEILSVKPMGNRGGVLTPLVNTPLVSRHHLVLDSRRKAAVALPLQLLRQRNGSAPNIRYMLRVRLELLVQHGQASEISAAIPRLLRRLAVERLEVRPGRPEEAIQARREPTLKRPFPATSQMSRDGAEEFLVEIPGARSPSIHAVSPTRRLVCCPVQPAHGPGCAPARGGGYSRIDSRRNIPVKVLKNVIRQSLANGLEAFLQGRLELLSGC